MLPRCWKHPDGWSNGWDSQLLKFFFPRTSFVHFCGDKANPSKYLCGSAGLWEMCHYLKSTEQEPGPVCSIFDKVFQGQT